MNRRKALAVAAGFAITIVAASVAIGANLGVLGFSASEKVGQLSPVDDSVTEAPTPRVVTVVVDDTPSPDVSVESTDDPDDDIDELDDVDETPTPEPTETPDDEDEDEDEDDEDEDNSGPSDDSGHDDEEDDD